MKTFKNVAYLALGTSAKMAAGLLTLVVIARVLGASGFGTLMIFLSAAGVLCIVSNLGINTYVLREVGRSPDTAAATISDALTAKLVLTSVTVGLSGVLAFISPKFADMVFALLLISLLAESFTEFLNVGLRATGNFSIETKQSMLAAIVYGTLVAGVGLVTEALLPVALAYSISRVIITAVAYISLRNMVGTVRPAPFGTGLRRLRETASYSVDAALSSLFGQVDGLVLGASLGAVAVGVYQGGLRIYMSASTGAGILTNVLLPKSAAEMVAGPRASAGNRNVILVFAVFGNVVGWAFAVVLPYVVVPLYGADFVALKWLMPWFGALFAARMVASGWGLLLTATGAQKYRTISSVAHWVVIALIAMQSVVLLGAKGWLVALLIGTAMLSMLYIRAGIKVTSNRLLVVAASCSPLVLIVYAMQLSRDVL